MYLTCILTGSPQIALKNDIPKEVDRFGDVSVTIFSVLSGILLCKSRLPKIFPLIIFCPRMQHG